MIFLPSFLSWFGFVCLLHFTFATMTSALVLPHLCVSIRFGCANEEEENACSRCDFSASVEWIVNIVLWFDGLTYINTSSQHSTLTYLKFVFNYFVWWCLNIHLLLTHCTNFKPIARAARTNYQELIKCLFDFDVEFRMHTGMLCVWCVASHLVRWTMATTNQVQSPFDWC